MVPENMGRCGLTQAPAKTSGGLFTISGSDHMPPLYLVDDGC